MIGWNGRVGFSHTRIDKWLKIRAGISTLGHVLQDPVIKVIGDKAYDGVKELVLLSHRESSSMNSSPSSSSNQSSHKLASVFVKRNIIFGSRIHQPGLSLVKTCSPLVNQALNIASEYGDQPQALASLYGLSNWVCSCLKYADENKTVENPSKVISKLLDSHNNHESRIILEAVTAIATQTPRQGQTTIGVGTYRDGRPGWEALAKEFATSFNDDGEPSLYSSYGGEIVQVEYLADTSPVYLKEAGGVLLRYFIL